MCQPFWCCICLFHINIKGMRTREPNRSCIQGVLHMYMHLSHFGQKIKRISLSVLFSLHWLSEDSFATSSCNIVAKGTAGQPAEDSRTCAWARGGHIYLRHIYWLLRFGIASTQDDISDWGFILLALIYLSVSLVRASFGVYQPYHSWSHGWQVSSFIQFYPVSSSFFQLHPV